MPFRLSSLKTTEKSCIKKKRAEEGVSLKAEIITIIEMISNVTTMKRDKDF